jgi:hypothetical protein
LHEVLHSNVVFLQYIKMSSLHSVHITPLS